MKFFIKLKNGCAGVEAGSLREAWRYALETFGMGNVVSVNQAAPCEVEFMILLNVLPVRLFESYIIPVDFA